MGELLDRLTSQLKTQGNKDPRNSAILFLRKQGSMKQDSLELTKKGLEREKMTPAERAIDRASKRSGRDPEDYEYDPKTNRATLKYGYR
jgi:hypothetical protein